LLEAAMTKRCAENQWYLVRVPREARDMIWYEKIWYYRYDMIWLDMIWYDMIWYDMIWYMIR
jgi:hypothetical protein